MYPAAGLPWPIVPLTFRPISERDVAAGWAVAVQRKKEKMDVLEPLQWEAV